MIFCPCKDGSPFEANDSHQNTGLNRTACHTPLETRPFQLRHERRIEQEAKQTTVITVAQKCVARTPTSSLLIVLLIFSHQCGYKCYPFVPLHTDSLAVLICCELEENSMRARRRRGGLRGRGTLVLVFCVIASLLAYVSLLYRSWDRIASEHAGAPQGSNELNSNGNDIEENFTEQLERFPEGYFRRGNFQTEQFLQRIGVNPRKSLEKEVEKIARMEILDRVRRSKRLSEEDRGLEADARDFIVERLGCGQGLEERGTVGLEIVEDGGLGVTLSQVLLTVNVALAMDLVPFFLQRKTLWFSSAQIEFSDIFSMPCGKDFSYLKRFQRQVVSCEGPCDRKLSFKQIWIPQEFRPKSLAWWWRQLATVIIQPSESLLSSIRRIPALAQSPIMNTDAFYEGEKGFLGSLFDFRGFRRPLIAMHIRRGDACRLQRPSCLDVQQILDMLHKEKLSFGTILLATDSAKMVAEVSEKSKGSFHGRVIAFNIDRSIYEEFIKNDRLIYEQSEKFRNKMLNSSDLALESLLDLALLSQGDIHVGSFYSNFIRMAMNLSHRNQDLRYITTDAKWCPFERCSIGYAGKQYQCERWHRHLCQWKPKSQCNKEIFGEEKCGNFGGTLCSDECGLFFQVLDSHFLQYFGKQYFDRFDPALQTFVEETTRYKCKTSELRTEYLETHVEKTCQRVKDWFEKAEPFLAENDLNAFAAIGKVIRRVERSIAG